MEKLEKIQKNQGQSSENHKILENHVKLRTIISNHIYSGKLQKIMEKKKIFNRTHHLYEFYLYDKFQQNPQRCSLVTAQNPFFKDGCLAAIFTEINCFYRKLPLCRSNSKPIRAHVLQYSIYKSWDDNTLLYL